MTLVLSIVVLSSTLMGTQSDASESEIQESPISESVDAQPEATECGMNVDIYVQEQMPDGTVQPLDFTDHPELDPLKWGFSDSINMPPYSEPASVISFTHPSQAKYTNFVGELSFAPFPKQSQIYQSEQDVKIMLAYESDRYEVLQREVKKCSIHGDQKWLCASREDAHVETFSGVPVRCGMDLSLGWIVRKAANTSNGPKNTSVEFSRTKPVDDFISTDLNGDGSTSTLDVSMLISAYGSHDPQSDVNKDGIVNGLDYSLLIDALRQKIQTKSS